MPLPFLNPRKIASVIVARQKEDGAVEPLHEEGEMEPGLMDAAERMIGALGMKDAKALAQAFQDAFMICESYPHEEAEGDE